MEQLNLKLLNEEIDYTGLPAGKQQACKWGIINLEFRVCRGLRWVSCGKTSGWLVSVGLANTLLNDETRVMGQLYGNYLCFTGVAQSSLEVFLHKLGVLDGYNNFSASCGPVVESVTA